MFFCQAGCKALAAVEKWTQCCAPGGRHATNNINAITRATPSRAFEREPPREVPGTLNSTYALVWTRLSWCCAPGGHHDTHDTKHGHAGAKRDAGRSVGCRDQRLPPALEPTQAGLTQKRRSIRESPKALAFTIFFCTSDTVTLTLPLCLYTSRAIDLSKAPVVRRGRPLLATAAASPSHLAIAASKGHSEYKLGSGNTRRHVNRQDGSAGGPPRSSCVHGAGCHGGPAATMTPPLASQRAMH